MATKLKEKMGFYRPHPRLAYTGELVNPITGEVTIPPSMTKQSFVEECDINNILKEYTSTGMLRHVSAKAEAGMYADLPDAPDFQESMNVVIRAEEAFASLPSKIRTRFHNDPVEFLDFLADPDNQDEAIKLGLATDKRATSSSSSSDGDKPPKPPAPPAGSAAPASPNRPTGGEGEPPLA